mmetsp:Transcript_71718/g.140693  ORF Transcript_71718/g.140693 Transcript_71718/m.140693 type:complete len:244 (+) Transcript_71718:283-1014(+)
MGDVAHVGQFHRREDVVQQLYQRKGSLGVVVVREQEDSAGLHPRLELGRGVAAVCGLKVVAHGSLQRLVDARSNEREHLLQKRREHICVGTRVVRPEHLPPLLRERFHAALGVPPLVVKTFHLGPRSVVFVENIKGILALQEHPDLPELVVDAVQLHWVELDRRAFGERLELFPAHTPHGGASVDEGLELQQLEALEDRVAKHVGLEHKRAVRVLQKRVDEREQLPARLEAPVLALAELCAAD